MQKMKSLGLPAKPRMLFCKFAFLLTACLFIVAPVWSSHTLTEMQRKVVTNWLEQHHEYRLATDEDCDCAEDIKNMRTGYSGNSKPVPDYHPYSVVGDFNGDGVEDFAVAVIDDAKKEKNFDLLVFNGPFKQDTILPAFTASGLDLQSVGLFYGPPRPKPYRLLVGRFETDSGSLIVPHGRGYRWGK
jgi:hypothetical protein